MFMRWVVESATSREKQFHACDNNEMLVKTETVLVQASMYKNDNKHSLKSRKQCSYEAKHKKH